MMKELIAEISKFETKVGLLEDGKLTEFFVEREENKRLLGNIYIGKVANILPGMESAFIDIGLEKNAFLYVDDLREFETKYLNGEVNEKPIEELLNVGDKVVVQILKGPRGTKGARVTTHFTIPGKYLILMPNNDYIAISKKISEEVERERLNEILADIKPEGVGVIIRTASKGKAKENFEKEIEYLIKKWHSVEEKIANSQKGIVIYREDNIMERIFRDLYSMDIDYLVVNSEKKYWEMIDYIAAFSSKENKMKVKLYSEGNIFDEYGITKELETALNKKVWLKCGGYLIIEKTEALISIDVNTGKNVGSMNLEETVFQTNIEAAKEIPRQLRLRNLGGIIIIDFIDMKLEKYKKELVETLEENLKRDRIRNNVVHFTELGLIEMTRKRVGKELSSYFLEECTHCKGFGYVKSKEVIINELIKEIKEVAKDEDIKKLQIKANPMICSDFNKYYKEIITSYLHNKLIEVVSEKTMNLTETEIILEK